MVALEVVLDRRSSSSPGSRTRRGRGSGASRTSSPFSATTSGRSPSATSRPGASVSGFANTNGPQVPTWTGTRPRQSMSKSGSSLLRGAAAQAAVEPVGPGVVGALDRAAPLRLVHEDGAAVAADVQERAQLPSRSSTTTSGQPADLRGEHAARAVELAQVPRRTATSAGRCCSCSAAAICRVGVPAVRQRLRARLDLRATHRRVILSKSICESNFRRMRTGARWARSPAASTSSSCSPATHPS